MVLAVSLEAIQMTRQPEAARRVMSFCPSACWVPLYRPSETMTKGGQGVPDRAGRPAEVFGDLADRVRAGATGRPVGNLTAKLAVASRHGGGLLTVASTREASLDDLGGALVQSVRTGLRPCLTALAPC